jgi:hypothetical protein
LRVTVRHYYDFGADRGIVGADLVTPEAWDGLRTRTTGVFSIPRTREEFIRVAEARRDIADRARAIDGWLAQQDARVVASYGVGGASLEWWLHRFRPDRRLILSDYGEATVERLAGLLPEVEVRNHDLRRDEPLPADLHLFHRIDTELSNPEWHDVFDRFGSASILLVAAEVLDAWKLLCELRDRLLMKHHRASRAGFVRTRGALEALWESTHASRPLRTHDLHAWSLTPKKPGTSRRSGTSAD